MTLCCNKLPTAGKRRIRFFIGSSGGVKMHEREGCLIKPVFSGKKRICLVLATSLVLHTCCCCTVCYLSIALCLYIVYSTQRKRVDRQWKLSNATWFWHQLFFCESHCVDNEIVLSTFNLNHKHASFWVYYSPTQAKS